MRPIDPHSVLPSLWLFLLLNIVFRDIHQFVMPGFLETVMTGEFNGIKITEELMLLGGVVVSVPISMVPLSVVLERRVLRPVTLVAALITAPTMIPPAPLDLDDTLHFGLQLAAIIAILWIVMRWQPARNSAEIQRGRLI